MVRFKGNKKITLAVQKFNLKKDFPESHCTIRRNRLTWNADLAPSDLSNTYTIQLECNLKKGLDIFVLKPELHIPEGERLPHTYSAKRLCLYYPNSGEWRGDLLISNTIVPWISEWLLNYEIWLACGKWCGGGEHPPTED